MAGKRRIMIRKIVAWSIAGLVLLAGCSKRAGGEDESSGTPARVPVRIGRMREGSIESIVTATGSTDAIRKEKVVAPVAARVVSLSVLEGSVVRKGDLLAVLRPREAHTAMEGARSLLRSATTEAERKEAERAIVLTDSSQPALTVRAGFDGVVATRSVSEGELVAEQAEIFTILDPATIIFVADIPVGTTGSVTVNCPARVTLTQLSLKRLDAVVDALSPQADAQSQTVRVRLRFRGLTPQEEKLMRTNLAGVAQIITGSHRNALLIDRSAILHDDESDVWSIAVLTPDSLAHLIPVRIGVQNDSVVEILDRGVHAGQQVILRGHYGLTDSTRVTVEAQ
jgi:multidrug efflux pump subunit AcrA (membrane-fusion protein)